MFRLPITSKIHVRILHSKDAEELFQLLEQNRARLRPWIHPSALPATLAATRIYTMECASNQLRTSLSDMDQIEAEGEAWISLPPRLPMEMGIWVEDRLAGVLTQSLPNGLEPSAEFGYWIGAEWEGKGIITRCVMALMGYAIDALGIDRFVIGCAVNNFRSRAIPERLGYRLVEIVPYGEIVGRQVYDRAIYEIESTVWREQSRTLAQPGKVG